MDVNCWTKAEAIGTVMAAVVVAGGFLYAEYLRSKLRGPRLRIRYKNELPFCRTAPIRDSKVNSLWVRLKVSNDEGRLPAKGCIVKLQHLLDRKGVALDSFDPVVLKWVRAKSTEAGDNGGDLPIDIIGGDYEWVNAFYCAESNSKWILTTTERKPRAILLAHPPGHYHLKVVVFAQNADPVQRWYRLEWSGEKYDGARMYPESSPLSRAMAIEGI